MSADGRPGIGAAELEDILEELVGEPSHAETPKREEAVASRIAGRFLREGIEAWLEPAGEGRVNVLAVVRGRESGPSLLLTGHTDTVPPYGMERACELRREGDWFLGRGVVDMKGALAAMLAAMLAVKRGGGLAGDLWFAGVADEEEASRGTIALLESGRRWDAAVVGEPSGLRICVAHRGLEWISLSLRGRAAHSGRREEGVNAIDKAARLLRALDEGIVPASSSRRHPYAGAEALNVGLIRGGTQPSTVPGECEIQVDYRWIPGRRWEDVRREFQALLDRLAADDPEFDCRLSVVPASRMRDGFLHEALEIDPGHPLVLAAAEARGVAGFDATEAPVSFPAWTDAGLLSTRGGIPSIVLGPGDLASAHSDHERLERSQLHAAAAVYAEIARRFCGSGGRHD